MGDYVTSDGYVNSYVNISATRTEDGGQYSCIAANDLYTIAHSGRVNIYGPAFVRQMGNRSALAGETLRIHCPAAGYPIESVSWVKRGAKLPQNHRQTVYPNGTLIVDKIERTADEDLYTCIVISTAPSNAAQGKLTNSASKSVFVKVHVAPVISPFNSPPNLREGMRSMLTCSVLEGDAPIRIEWFKDGKLLSSLTPSRNVKIDSSNEFSSTLFIANVSFDDSGNYTCRAENAHASANYTATMVVNGER